MKRGDIMPSNYLGKDDFPQDTLCTIKEVVREEIKGDSGKEDKAVLYLMNPSNDALDCTRGVILNVGNWEACEEISGQDDSDNWPGTMVVLYTDSSVMFAGKRVGGLRIRAARMEAPAKAEPAPAPSGQDDSIPF